MRNKSEEIMRAVVQRVSSSKVIVDSKTTGSIDNGLMVLLGIGHDDTHQDLIYLADKIANLRIFEDENGKMNLSVLDIHGEILVVSQFTLFANCLKGNRPSFVGAAPPEMANKLYCEFVEYIREKYSINVGTGIFQASMHLEIHNEGPVTIFLDSAMKIKNRGGEVK
jgi:D-tyrosyl-tRNA(Tyr) deacylase